MNATERPGSDGTGSPESVGSRLKNLLHGPGTCQLMGVHDGLSARIAVAEGFEALWASGLCMSTARGVRDSDEASWTELLTLVGTMTEAAPGAPVLVDGDTGYGNFNTARRFAARAERVGAAGVCFEDKVFPKMNSFFGDGHQLAPIGEFSGKIKACKDTQRDPGFVVVARTEALISNLPMEEALTRAHAYVEAGADGLFIHSRMSTPQQIAEFMRQWDGSAPILIAPTTYHRPSLDDFAALGIAGCIWANHSMRAAFSAMRDVCQQIRADRGIFGVEERVAPLKEIFGLLDYESLEQDENRYTQAPDLAPVQG
ncbi:phosphonopyruvate hydrolase [Streptomyces viridochromogenes DSM 40736]|uniref:phosphoenolpyruvate mutase n=2 Tax=Streptomyces viridochromogenes TaxID=1938 RepID=D9XF42_STRVT|nr:phosphoenolpyruvate mutase [Streptomyces viridochromogenes]AAU00071.1 phosphoenolpyruvate phosphomutase [Streptomyces viridochromogenes]EFL30521.1 phosphonopyruvate hydrolase [Streptomyces viridochromogenes DSM 40736]